MNAWKRWGRAWERSEKDVVIDRAFGELMHRRLRLRTAAVAFCGWYGDIARKYLGRFLVRSCAVASFRLLARIHTCGTCGEEFCLDRWNLPPGGGFTPICPVCRPDWVGKTPPVTL